MNMVPLPFFPLSCAGDILLHPAVQVSTQTQADRSTIYLDVNKLANM
jgi:hypothetical protein